ERATERLRQAADGAVVRCLGESRMEVPRELARVVAGRERLAAVLAELAQLREIVVGRARARERYGAELDDQARLDDVLGRRRRPELPLTSDTVWATFDPVGAVTNAPPRAPTFPSISPIASSERSASRTVTRLTPNCSASSRSGERRSPALSRPVRIAVRICS